MGDLVKGACWVVVEDNQLILYDNSGNEIQCRIAARLTDNVGEFPQILLRAIVNIADNKDQMVDQLKEWKKEDENG